MINIQLSASTPVSQNEIMFAAHLLEWLCSQSDSAVCPMISNTQIGYSKEGTDYGCMPKENFLRCIKTVQQVTLTLAVDTYTGKKAISVPFMPVTLIDIPNSESATVCLNEVPEFMPYFEDDGKIRFRFRGTMSTLIDLAIDDDDVEYDEEYGDEEYEDDSDEDDTTEEANNE